MERSALFHQPQSEYAYLMPDGKVQLRLRAKLGDLKAVSVYYQDPFLLLHGHDFLHEDMPRLVSTQDHDYFQVDITVPTRRVVYFFMVTDDHNQTFRYGELGVFQGDGQWPQGDGTVYEDKDMDKPDLEPSSELPPQPRLSGQAPLTHYTGETQGGGGQALPTMQGEATYQAVTMIASNNAFKLPYLHQVDAYQAPQWVEETVWYQIFPERFNNGRSELSPENARPWDPKVSPRYDDFFGGDIPGITAKLDYLKDLGINGIYLCPIFKAGTNHKYDTVDYYDVDPHFGTKEDLRTLIDQAHARDIRIMFDAVFNHMGVGSPQWQDVLAKGADSEYVDWFHIHEFPIDHLRPLADGRYNYETFAFADLMPKLNTSHPEVRQYLLDIATYWVREFNIDGWRLDVANEIDHAFWKAFHTAVTKVKSDAYILGEVWHYSQPWLQGDEFHAVMNYPLTYALQDFFIHDSLTSDQLLRVLSQIQMTYRQPTQRVQFNFLDSHDTARILHIAQGNVALVKQMLAFLFLQPGTPCIYYGTEVGVTGGPDPDCRRVMPWQADQQDTDMLTFMQALIAFRRQHHRQIQASGIQDYQVMGPQALRMDIEEGNQGIHAIFNHGSHALDLGIKPVHVILSQGYDEGQARLERHGFMIYQLEEEA